MGTIDSLGFSTTLFSQPVRMSVLPKLQLSLAQQELVSIIEIQAMLKTSHKGSLIKLCLSDIFSAQEG